jgi:hypothetical protein
MQWVQHTRRMGISVGEVTSTWLAFDELLERALDAFVREAKAGGNWSSNSKSSGGA